MNTFNEQAFQENPNKTYKSNNYGDFRVTGYIDCFNVNIEFLATGFKLTTRAGDIRKGNAKDKLKPSVCGIGFIGVGIGNHKLSINRKHTKAYKTWNSMLQRCYCPKTQERQPTYIGCSVAPIWHNFQNFAVWFELNYQDGLQLDKDIIKKDNKVYCPEFCKFVTLAENNTEANAKHYKFISHQGALTKIYNLAEFCRNNDLNTSHMSQVHLDKRPHHKGWRLA